MSRGRPLRWMATARFAGNRTPPTGRLTFTSWASDQKWGLSCLSCNPSMTVFDHLSPGVGVRFGSHIPLHHRSRVHDAPCVMLHAYASRRRSWFAPDFVALFSERSIPDFGPPSFLRTRTRPGSFVRIAEHCFRKPRKSPPQLGECWSTKTDISQQRRAPCRCTVIARFVVWK